MVTAAGTSVANYLAFAALLDPGDEVLIEQPAYGLLTRRAASVGAVVNRFARTHENGYALDPEAVRRAVTPRTKLIVLTNLHNPSSVLTGEDVLREVGEIARSVGARVLVDEVYLDAVYENTPRTLVPPGPGVRGDQQPDEGVRRQRAALRVDSGGAGPGARHVAVERLLAATPVHPGELLSVAAFAQLDTVRERYRRIVQADRLVLNAFLDRRSGLTRCGRRGAPRRLCAWRAAMPRACWRG